MAPLNLANFVHSLCRFVAAGTSLEYLSTPRALWRNDYNDAQASDPVTVLRPYPGAGTNWEAVPSASIQCLTVGTSGDGALAQSQKVFESLLNSEGRPLSMKVIDGYTTANVADGTWRLIAIAFLQRPGLLGRNPQDRHQAVFNFDVDFVKLT